MTRQYTVEQVETYYVKANSEEEAIEIVNNTDNASAYRVERRVVFVGGEDD